MQVLGPLAHLFALLGQPSQGVPVFLGQSLVQVGGIFTPPARRRPVCPVVGRPRRPPTAPAGARSHARAPRCRVRALRPPFHAGQLRLARRDLRFARREQLRPRLKLAALLGQLAGGPGHFGLAIGQRKPHGPGLRLPAGQPGVQLGLADIQLLLPVAEVGCQLERLEPKLLGGRLVGCRRLRGRGAAAADSAAGSAPDCDSNPSTRCGASIRAFRPVPSRSSSAPVVLGSSSAPKIRFDHFLP